MKHFKLKNQECAQNGIRAIGRMRPLLIMLGLICCLNASAAETYLWGTANGTRFYLKVEDPVNKTVQVHANSETSYSGDIVIPEKIIAEDGIEYTINLVDQRAFSNNTAITSISIPGTVTEIGQYTFSGCTALKTVTLGKGVERIFKYAFENCTSLETITFPHSNLFSRKRPLQDAEALPRCISTTTTRRPLQAPTPSRLSPATPRCSSPMEQRTDTKPSMDGKTSPRSPISCSTRTRHWHSPRE